MQNEQCDPTKELLRWYNRKGRELPWRLTREPYKIWVSEVLLQQTQAARCIPFYQAFIKKFPTVHDLARASWRNVLPVWRGLGFYRRGKNMLLAAKIIVTEHNGDIPDTYEELVALPGIGPYTASAILSFAFDHPVPALDTNLNRVLARYYGIAEKEVKQRAVELYSLHKRSASKMNHALMDVGALLCKANSIDCERCPLREGCDFFLKERKPTGRKKAQQKVTLKEVGAACIHRNGEYLIAKRPKSKGGLWEFPGGKREKGESLRACIKREIQEELGIEVSVRPPFAEKVISIGQERFRLLFCRCQILKGQEKPYEHEKLAWAKPSAMYQYNLCDSNLSVVSKLKVK